MARTRRLMALALMISAGLLALAVQAWRRSSPVCAADAQALKGEVMRAPDGKMLYFDGRCWTSTPLPPRDTPF